MFYERKQLTCKCGAKFENEGVFVTCERCRHAYSEEEKLSQTGCHNWLNVTEVDPRVNRQKREHETF